MGGGKVVKLKNTTSTNITVVEILGVKETTLAPGEELEVDPSTTVVEIRG